MTIKTKAIRKKAAELQPHADIEGQLEFYAETLLDEVERLRDGLGALTESLAGEHLMWTCLHDTCRDEMLEMIREALGDE